MRLFVVDLGGETAQINNKNTYPEFTLLRLHSYYMPGFLKIKPQPARVFQTPAIENMPIVMG